MQGDLLASASADKSVRLWDANTGSVVRVLDGHGQVPERPLLSDFWTGCTSLHSLASATLLLPTALQLQLSMAGMRQLPIHDAPTGSPLET